MNSIAEIKQISDEKLHHARILATNGANSSAYYLAGYCIELELKARICHILDYPSFFDSNIKDKGLKDVFYSHNLDRLILVSGLHNAWKAKIVLFTDKSDWDRIINWKPETRYSCCSNITNVRLSNFLNAIENYVCTMDQRELLKELRDKKNLFIHEGNRIDFKYLGIRECIPGVISAPYYVVADSDYLDRIQYDEGCGAASDILFQILNNILSKDAWNSIAGTEIIHDIGNKCINEFGYYAAIEEC